MLLLLALNSSSSDSNGRRRRKNRPKKEGEEDKNDIGAGVTAGSFQKGKIRKETRRKIGR